MDKENKNISIIYAPISLGELIDKITILQIKKEKIKGNQLKNIIKEYSSLNKILLGKDCKVDSKLVKELKLINHDIWNIEDQIRKKEKLKEYDKDFIELARSVYKKNDARASIKREINKKYNSDIIEEKSYEKY